MSVGTVFLCLVCASIVLMTSTVLLAFSVHSHYSALAALEQCGSDEARMCQHAGSRVSRGMWATEGTGTWERECPASSIKGRLEGCLALKGSRNLALCFVPPIPANTLQTPKGQRPAVGRSSQQVRIGDS